MANTLVRPKLSVELDLKSMGLEKGLDRSASKLKGFGGKLGGIGRSLGSKFGTAFQVAGGVLIAQTVGRALAVVRSEFGRTIFAASDLNETISKTRAVFGATAQDMLDWAKNSETALGISEQAALDAGSIFGGMAKGAGLTGDAVNTFAKDLTQAGADLGSFFNVDPTQVLEDLRSGLAGESEPLRKYNIFINEAAVKTEAYRLGLAKAGDELTEQQKILARQSLILRGVGDAAGDFAKTSGGLANGLRIATAWIQSFRVWLGQKTLPFVNRGLQLFNRMAKRISDLTGKGVRPLTAVLKSLHVVLNRLFGRAFGGFLFEVIREGIRVVRLFKALVTGDWALAWKTFQRIGRDAWRAVVAGARGGAKLLSRALTGAISRLKGIKIGRLTLRILDWGLEQVVRARDLLRERLRDWIGEGGRWLVKLGKLTIEVKDWAITEVFPLATRLAHFVSDRAPDIAISGRIIGANLIRGAWEWIRDNQETILAVLKTIFIQVPMKAGEIVGEHGPTIIIELLARMTKYIIDHPKEVGIALAKMLALAVVVTIAVMAAPFVLAGAFMIGLVKGLAEWFQKSVVPWLRDLPGRIFNAAGDVFGAGKGLGASIVNGLVRGIASLWPGFVSWLSGLFDKLPGPLKKALGALSPSRVFADIGKDVVLGFKMGIDRNLPLAHRAVAQIGAGQAGGGRARLMPMPAVAGGARGGTAAWSTTGPITINVNGASNPEIVGEVVMRRLMAAKNRRNAGRRAR